MTCQVRPNSSIMVAAHLTNKDININIIFRLWYLHVPWKSWLLISQYIIPVSGFLTTCLQVCVDFSPPHPVCSIPTQNVQKPGSIVYMHTILGSIEELQGANPGFSQTIIISLIQVFETICIHNQLLGWLLQIPYNTYYRIYFEIIWS